MPELQAGLSTLQEMMRYFVRTKDVEIHTDYFQTIKKLIGRAGFKRNVELDDSMTAFGDDPTGMCLSHRSDFLGDYLRGLTWKVMMGLQIYILSIVCKVSRFCFCLCLYGPWSANAGYFV